MPDNKTQIEERVASSPTDKHWDCAGYLPSQERHLLEGRVRSKDMLTEDALFMPNGMLPNGLTKLYSMMAERFLRNWKVWHQLKDLKRLKLCCVTERYSAFIYDIWNVTKWCYGTIFEWNVFKELKSWTSIKSSQKSELNGNVV